MYVYQSLLIKVTFKTVKLTDFKHLCILFHLPRSPFNFKK